MHGVTPLADWLEKIRQGAVPLCPQRGRGLAAAEATIVSRTEPTVLRKARAKDPKYEFAQLLMCWPTTTPLCFGVAVRWPRSRDAPESEIGKPNVFCVHFMTRMAFLGYLKQLAQPVKPSRC